MLSSHCSRLRVAYSLLTLLPMATMAAPPPVAQAAAFLEKVWHSSGAPGLSAAVSVQGRIVFAEGLGLADLRASSGGLARMPPAGASSITAGP
jgi:hypothetical protein